MGLFGDDINLEAELNVDVHVDPGSVARSAEAYGRAIEAATSAAVRRGVQAGMAGSVGAAGGAAANAGLIAQVQREAQIASLIDRARMGAPGSFPVHGGWLQQVRMESRASSHLAQQRALDVQLQNWRRGQAAQAAELAAGRLTIGGLSGAGVSPVNRAAAARIAATRASTLMLPPDWGAPGSGRGGGGPGSRPPRGGGRPGDPHAATGPFAAFGQFAFLARATAWYGFIRAMGALRNLMTDSVRVAASWDRIRLGIGALIGNRARGGVVFDQLRQLSRNPGLSFPESAEGFQRLIAAGFKEQGALKFLKELGNASALVGASSDDTNRAITAFAQILGKGKVQAEEMTRQLYNAIPVLRLVAKEAFGTSEAEGIMKAVNGDVEEFFRRMLKGMSELERAPLSFEKILANVGLSLTELKEQFGRGFATPELRRALADVSAQSSRASKTLEAMGAGFGALIVKIGQFLRLLPQQGHWAAESAQDRTGGVLVGLAAEMERASTNTAIRMGIAGSAGFTSITPEARHEAIRQTILEWHRDGRLTARQADDLWRAYEGAGPGATVQDLGFAMQIHQAEEARRRDAPAWMRRAAETFSTPDLIAPMTPEEATGAGGETEADRAERERVRGLLAVVDALNDQSQAWIDKLEDLISLEEARARLEGREPDFALIRGLMQQIGAARETMAGRTLNPDTGLPDQLARLTGTQAAQRATELALLGLDADELESRRRAVEEAQRAEEERLQTAIELARIEQDRLAETAGAEGATQRLADALAALAAFYVRIGDAAAAARTDLERFRLEQEKLAQGPLSGLQEIIAAGPGTGAVEDFLRGKYGVGAARVDPLGLVGGTNWFGGIQTMDRLRRGVGLPDFGAILNPPAGGFGPTINDSDPITPAAEQAGKSMALAVGNVIPLAFEKQLARAVGLG